MKEIKKNILMLRIPFFSFGWLVGFIVFNFSYIVAVSFIGGGHGENHRPAASH
jgi:hypothetical protein